jgi:hypothetical protein
MSVGANRAAIFCNLAVSDTDASWPKALTVHIATINAVTRIDDMKAILVEVRGERSEVRG